MRKSLPALVVALIAALLAVPATYAAQRAVDVCFTAAPGPAASATPVAVFWRLAVAAYAAGFVGALAFMAARGNLARAVRVLYVLVFVVAAAVGVQGLALP